MKTKERELANKIAAHWYDKLHMQHAPIFQKQKLADYVETELKTLGLFSVSPSTLYDCDDCMNYPCVLQEWSSDKLRKLKLNECGDKVVKKLL